MKKNSDRSQRNPKGNRGINGNGSQQKGGGKGKSSGGKKSY